MTRRPTHIARPDLGSTAFVLSGGGSLGAVQVGMLQALSHQGIQPDLLVGTSAGAVNALWVAEHGMSVDSLTELARIWQGLHRRDIFPIRPTHVMHALAGRSAALSSSEPLGELVRAHSDIADLTETQIPVHLLATDLLSGKAVLISSGCPSDAVRASAAIPGIFAPISLDGRWLIDGALSAPAGVAHAARLGATQIYVLPAGVPCALLDPPRSAVGIAVQALTLMIEQSLMAEVAWPPPSASVHLIPPLCPVTTSAADFAHATELIQRARRAGTKWIDEGGLDVSDPARFLTLHDHDHDHDRDHDRDQPSGAGSVPRSTPAP